MRQLLPVAERIGALLKERGETVAVAESSAGGLISAALLAVPGASVYFVGGGVFYSRPALLTLRDVTARTYEGMRSASEPWALMLARLQRERSASVWGLSECGAAGPTGNRYGDPAGHAWVAVTGPAERTQVVATANSDRLANMYAFAAAALALFAKTLDEQAAAA
jgi:nicotinamide-nucleotide amidase